MDYSQINFRCSSLGNLFTEGRSKTDRFGVTAKKQMRKDWLFHKYGITDNINSKYLRKGTDQEEDSLTLYTHFHNAKGGTITVLKKNEERLSNDFLTGEVDTFIGKSLRQAKVIIDTKTAWDKISFYNILDGVVKKENELQGTGYMDLTGAETAIIAHCLVNTAPHLVNNELYYLQQENKVDRLPKWAAILEVIKHIHTQDAFDSFLRDFDYWPDDTESTSAYKMFKEMTIQERVHEFIVQRDNSLIVDIHSRVVECRDYMMSNFK